LKPLTVSLCAVALAAAVVGTAIYQAPRQVKLPVYTEPIQFFTEGKQGITLASLPKGIHTLSAQSCAGCHKEQHADWQGSAHARSVTEPVFAAAFKAEPRFLCRSCHSPLLEQHPKLLTRLDGDPRVLLNGQQMPLSQQMPPSHPATDSPFPAVTTADLRTASGPMRVTGNLDGQPFLNDPNPRYDKALAAEGVTCVTCHVREGTVLTSNPTASSRAPHALSYSPQMKKSDFCGGCHQFDIKSPLAHPFERPAAPQQARNVPQGAQAQALLVAQMARQQSSVSPAISRRFQFIRQQGAITPVVDGPESPENEDPPVPPQPELESQYQQEPRIQDTLDEFKISPAAARGETCQSCHMPSRKGSRQHTWPGRDSLTMLQQAVSLSVKLSQPAYEKGEKLQAVIKLKNDAGHRFPTGDSIHAGILDVWLRDGKKTLGRQVFVMSNQNQNLNLTRFITGNQIQLSGNVRMLQIAENGATVPKLDAPHREDTRLMPGEEATLLYRQEVGADIAKAKNLTLRVRVFHAAVHPGFKGSGIDSGKSTLRVFREETLPISITPGAGKAPQSAQGAVSRVRG